MKTTLEILFVSFIFYSFVGWFWESILLNFFQTKAFTNSGFLLGPYYPIYGAGATICVILYSKYENPITLFVYAAIIC